VIVYEPNSLGVPAWRVESASGGKYRVLVPDFPSREGAQCSCLDFLTRGLGTCKHLEAALAHAAAEPPADLSTRVTPPLSVPSWSALEEEHAHALDKALATSGEEDPREVLRALRRVGRVLTN
jgi:hypothetical protein